MQGYLQINRHATVNTLNTHDMGSNIILGERLKRRRELLGIAIAAIAARMNVSCAALHRLEGKDRIAMATITKIAKCMCLSAEDIIELTEEEFRSKYLNSNGEPILWVHLQYNWSPADKSDR